MDAMGLQRSYVTNDDVAEVERLRVKLVLFGDSPAELTLAMREPKEIAGSEKMIPSRFIAPRVLRITSSKLSE